jgi:hypothetical protein
MLLNVFVPKVAAGLGPGAWNAGPLASGRADSAGPGRAGRSSHMGGLWRVRLVVAKGLGALFLDAVVVHVCDELVVLTGSCSQLV